MTYLADYEVNRGRQPEIDCLKALVIIIMIFLHVFEGCTERISVTYYILTYLECLTGAGTFMLCMGIGARYSRHQTPKDYLRRGFELLTVGQALNLVRVSLPYLILWWINGDSAYLSNALLIIQADILSFAGFAFMLLALLKRMRFSDGAIVLTGIIMNAFAYVLFRCFHTTGNFLVDQLLAYFIVTDAEAYFPLCSYFVYVAFGYALGRIYLRIRNKDALSVRVVLLVPGLPQHLALQGHHRVRRQDQAFGPGAAGGVQGLSRGDVLHRLPYRRARRYRRFTGGGQDRQVEQTQHFQKLPSSRGSGSQNEFRFHNRVP